MDQSPQLGTLILSKCAQLRDADLAALRDLAYLHALKLDHCDAITARGIAHVAQLSQLRYLSAAHIPELRHPGACTGINTF